MVYAPIIPTSPDQVRIRKVTNGICHSMSDLLYKAAPRDSLGELDALSARDAFPYFPPDPHHGPNPPFVFPEPSQVASDAVDDAVESGTFDTSQLSQFHTRTDWNLFFHRVVQEFQTPVELHISDEAALVGFLELLIGVPDTCGDNTDGIAVWLFSGLSDAAKHQIIAQCVDCLSSPVCLRLFAHHAVVAPAPDLLPAALELPLGDIVPVCHSFSQTAWFTEEIRFRFLSRVRSFAPCADFFTALGVLKVTPEEFPGMLPVAFRAVESGDKGSVFTVYRLFAQLRPVPDLALDFAMDRLNSDEASLREKSEIIKFLGVVLPGMTGAIILFSIVDVRIISMFYRRWLAV
jgi:hypothetical protein